VNLEETYGLQTGSYHGSAMLVSSDSKRLLVIATNSYMLQEVEQVQNLKIARGYPSYFQTTSMLMLDISNKTSPIALSMEQVMTLDRSKPSTS